MYSGLLYLTIYLLGNYTCFFRVFFSKSAFVKISFRNTTRVSSSLDQDQARRYVGSDLGLNCLQRLSADDTEPKSLNVYMCKQ